MIYFLMLLLILCTSSCTSSEPQISETDRWEQTNRSVENAKAIALNAVDIFGNNASRSSNNVDVNDPFVITTSANSRSEVADTLLYVFNYADKKGFAVVSAANIGTPLLAYIEDGSFEPGESFNGGFQMFMNNAAVYAAERIAEQRVVGIEPILQTKYVTEWYARDEIKPRISVEWGRTRWEGAFCPNGDAGMEAIVAAQVLSYYEQPKFVKDYTGRILNSGVLTELDWSEIKKHEISNHDLSYSDANNPSFVFCPASDLAHIHIGLLCREIGEYCSTEYKSTGTEIIPISVIDCLTHYLGNFNFSLEKYYSSMSDDDDLVYERMEDYDVKNALKSGFLYMSASDKNNKHYSWVADGFIDAEIYGNIYTSSNGLVWNLIESHKVEEGLFVHYNWGDYGKCNGYFNRKIVNPQRATVFDKPWLNNWTSEFTNTDELVVACINIPINQ